MPNFCESTAEHFTAELSQPFARGWSKAEVKENVLLALVVLHHGLKQCVLDHGCTRGSEHGQN
jgi:hypothetical protein